MTLDLVKSCHVNVELVLDGVKVKRHYGQVPTPSPTKPVSMSTLVDGLLSVTTDLHRTLAAVAAEHGLTAQQAMLLRMLTEPVPMSVFATEMACDPSNVTGLVSRLERLGLVVRLPKADDRRIRLLSLTGKGERLRDRLGADLTSALTAQWQLDRTEAGRLHRALQRINAAV
jgi:DNA-binding MarR family transcriptional regulator